MEYAPRSRVSVKISEFSKRTGLSPDTIRFYESKGLLSPERSSDNRYREFSERDLETAKEILAGQQLGFTLEEIRRGIDLWQAGKAEKSAKIAFLTQRLFLVENRIQELSETKNYLHSKLNWISQGEEGLPPEMTQALSRRKAKERDKL